VRRRRWLLLTGTVLAGAFTIVTANVSVPQAARIALGVLIVFVLPGFAILCAVFPGQQLSTSERLLASVGTSLAMTTSASVLLGTTPMGLSQESLAVTLGATTIAGSVIAGIRTRYADEA
jgi:uncharacterized membrane protein